MDTDINVSGPLAMYLSKVVPGELNKDANQQKVVERLQALHEKLKTYQPQGNKSISWFKVRDLVLIYMINE